MTFNWSSEPALYVGLIDALLILAVTFGVPINPEQKTAIDGVLAAVLTIVGSVVVRSQVTPSAHLQPVPVPVPVPVVTPPAA